MFIYQLIDLCNPKSKEGLVSIVVNNRNENFPGMKDCKFPFEIKKKIGFFASQNFILFDFDKKEILKKKIAKISKNFELMKNYFSPSFLIYDPLHFGVVTPFYEKSPFIEFNFIVFQKKESSIFEKRINNSFGEKKKKNKKKKIKKIKNKKNKKNTESGYYKFSYDNPINCVQLLIEGSIDQNNYLNSIWNISFVYNEAFFTEDSMKNKLKQYLKNLENFATTSNY